MPKILTKLCGFTDEDSVKAAITQKCDFLGFVFYDQSPRYITPEKAAKISVQVPANIAKVAVVVDANFEFLAEIAQKFSPDFFQFHGSESPDFLAQARAKFSKIKTIKAFKIKKQGDLARIADFENCADFLLFDGATAGSGKKFDWEILKNLNSKKDWFLSGGLNSENIEEALEITGARMVDISSGIENAQGKNSGKKSPKLIEEFMKKIQTKCC